MKPNPNPSRLSPRGTWLTAVACAAATLVPAARADITYTLQFNPASSGQAQQVANSVAVAAAFYNQHGSFNKHWNVYYNPGIPTAEGNYDGYMGFGGIRNERVAFHEAAHTFGMGTHGAYGGLIAGGVWRGQYGNRAQFESYNDFGDGLHGDGHAIWPSGFNYDNEDGLLQRHWHTRIMAGIRTDMGILSYTREARNEAVVTGETAEFQVQAPLATTHRWHRNGTPLTNGGDISGATTATLKIANAKATDAGSYHCVVTGAGETLNSRSRQLWVHPAPLVGRWNFDGNGSDATGTHPATINGGAGYTPGKTGTAVDLDGVDDFVDLPDAVGRLRELTITSWVNWDGGGDWQRVFDFGTGTNQYLCLTPKASGGGLRLVLKDAINYRNLEFQVNAPTLAIGQWVHLSVVVRENYMTLYVNGQVAGTTFGINRSPADFPAVNNYVGKSQFADPYFNGRIDDFRVYGKALDGSEIWPIWGQSANQAPVFQSPLITLPAASALQPFTGRSLATYASDADQNPLTYTKLSGPAWMTVNANGALSGQPGPGDNGESSFVVRVSDPSGASSDATVRIQVHAPPTAPVTSNPTPPAVDADDISYIATNLGEPDAISGTTNSADNDESTYLAEDRTSKGQTFTTGSHPEGYLFRSFSFQHVNWPSLTPAGTAYNVQPGDQWEFQIGKMTGLVKTPVLKYIATYDGEAFAGSTSPGTGRWFTFNISGFGVRLAPATTYYFEVAPLSGDPFFELNSHRAGTYAGGTAYRGTTPGIIGTNVNALPGDFIFHADLKAKPTIPASTVAYWNFEEAAANTGTAYSRTNAGQYDGGIIDQTGNGNNLSTWTTDWHRYRANVPAPVTPQTGAPNLTSLQNTNPFPALSALGTSLSQWSPEAWTLEAAIRPDDATIATFQTFIGRDSYGGFAGDLPLAALYFAITPTGALRFVFNDAAGNNWALNTPANTVQDAKWQAVAATSDGDTLSLYLKNLSNGDAGYTLLGTLDLSASSQPALSTGRGDGPDWDAGVFTVGRGLFNGTHTDRFFGHIDDVRFSNGALAPAAFLYSNPVTPPTGYPAWISGYPAVGGSVGFNQDPDGDGLPNGVEALIGTDPSIPNSGLTRLARTGNTLSFRHPRGANAASHVTASYQWSSDLRRWNGSGQTVEGTTITFNASPDTPEAGTTTVTGTITGVAPPGVFVRLQATQP